MSAIKGRGAPSNARPSRFNLPDRQADGDWLDHVLADDEDVPPPLRTTVTQEKARTIITRNNSPDIGFDQSINAYRGCEHPHNLCVVPLRAQDCAIDIAYDFPSDFPSRVFRGS